MDLAQEVVAHLRQTAGADALLGAFNSARQAVQAARDERRREQAVQVMGAFIDVNIRHSVCSLTIIGTWVLEQWIARMFAKVFGLEHCSSSKKTKCPILTKFKCLCFTLKVWNAHSLDATFWPYSKSICVHPEAFYTLVSDSQPWQAMLDPQAAARSNLQKQARRAKGRKRKMEDLARMRSAGAPVKNKRPRKKAVE